MSSRRSSASSSGSQTKPIIARPDSHAPTASTPNDNPEYFARQEEELLASQQSLHPRADGTGYGNGTRPPVPNGWKGKQRASNNERPTFMFHIGEDRPREYRCAWSINEEIARVGADAWVERDRVILILGRESVACLLVPFLWIRD